MGIAVSAGIAGAVAAGLAEDGVDGIAVRDGGEEVFGIVAMLVAAGADVTTKDDRLQENPLGFAVREYKDELEPTMQLLREKSASASP